MHPSNFFTYISNSISGGFPGLPDNKQVLSPDFNPVRSGTGSRSEEQTSSSGAKADLSRPGERTDGQREESPGM